MKLKDSNIFPMPNGWPSPTGDKFLHIATIEHQFKEYIYFICLKGPSIGKAYIEEVVLNSNSNSQEIAANLTRIFDENLKEDLAAFVANKKLNDIPSIVNRLIDTGHISWLS
jgi:hypothetical protein